MLLAAGGTLPAEAGNRASTEGDPMAHAETAAIRDAARAHGEGCLSGATPFSSAEPCAMCAAASCVAGIGRVVFGLREPDLPHARGGPLPWLPVQLPAAEVASRGRCPMAVEGPFLEDEAAVPRAGLGGGEP